MDSKTGICRFCGQKRNLVDLHIIPRVLSRGLDHKNAKFVQLISLFEAEYPK